MYKIGLRFRAPNNLDAVYTVSSNHTAGGIEHTTFSIKYPSGKTGSWTCHTNQVQNYISEGSFIRLREPNPFLLPEELFNVG